MNHPLISHTSCWAENEQISVKREEWIGYERRGEGRRREETGGWDRLGEERRREEKIGEERENEERV